MFGSGRISEFLTGQRDRRELVADALAHPGRHNDEAMSTFEDSVDHRVLAAPESVMTEDFKQNIGWSVHGRDEVA